jgi:hypothetical protein
MPFNLRPTGWGAFATQYVLGAIALGIVWQITRSSLATGLACVIAALIFPRVFRDEHAPSRDWDRGLGLFPILVLVIVILGTAAVIYLALDGIADWAGWHPSPWVSGWLGVFLGVRLGIEAARSLGGKPGM